jgi:serine/threonine-protein kinase
LTATLAHFTGPPRSPRCGTPTCEEHVIQPGTVLRERYKIIESVKSGGMGAVYEAEDLRLEGRRCALKEILLDPGMDELARTQAQEQFHREASILARLDHPNLPKVSDYFSESDQDFLVMDFVPGRDLKEVMDEARRAGYYLEERDVLNWAAQLMDALEYMHTQEPPVVHRDIKPSNIKLTPDGRIKLVDFGLVKLLAPGDDRTITILQGRGTAAYTPLEQYGGDVGHTDVRSDIYSLGATFYHLLTNQPPIDAKQRFLHPQALAAPTELNPRISPRVEQAILCALELHPADRPASMAGLKAELMGKNASEQAAPASQVSTLATVFARNRVLAGACAALLGLAFLVTVFAPPQIEPAATPAPFPSPTRAITRTP